MKKWLYTLIACGLSLPALSYAETAAKPLFHDGKGFFTYKKPLNEELAEDGKLKLVYFFHYDCAACVAGDDYLKMYASLHPEKVVLERYPFFNEGKTFTARMYATFLALGRQDLSDLYLFDSADKKGDASLVNSERAVEKWLSAHDVDIHAFKTLFNSDVVKQQVQEFVAISKKYHPPLAPFVSINGKYVLTHSTLYNDDYTYAVLDFLYDQEKQTKEK